MKIITIRYINHKLRWYIHPQPRETTNKEYKRDRGKKEEEMRKMKNTQRDRNDQKHHKDMYTYTYVHMYIHFKDL